MNQIFYRFTKEETREIKKIEKGFSSPYAKRMDAEAFNNQFYVLSKTNLTTEHTVPWYSAGIQLVLNTDSLSQKEDILTKMLVIFPKNYELYYYMGCIYKDTRPYMALSWFRTCFEHDPNNIENILDYVKLLFNLNMLNYLLQWSAENGNLLENTKNLRLMFMSATIFIKTGDLQRALTLYNHILQNIYEISKSTIIFVYLNYANLLSKIGYLKEAFLNYNTVILPWLKNNEGEDFLQAYDAKMAVKSLYENYLVLFDYNYHNIEERYFLCREIYHKLYATNTPSPFSFLKKRIHDDDNILSIGYVSSDFQEHAVSNFILPILANHTSHFRIYLFSQKSVNTSNFPPNVCIHNIQFMDDNTCAKLIYDCNIDILFDLNGYTDGNRLGVFSLQPCPIQVNYLGYPNSLCVDFIQYRITDAIADSKDSKQIYTETRIYLPKCFLLFESILQKSPVPRSPRDPHSPILFAALNKELKNSTNALNAWGCVLQRVPNSRLFIKIDSNDMYESRLQYYSRAMNVDASRIVIVCKCSNAEYIDLFGRIDILLDTFPYSGTTTTCNALYNSVPIISLYNKDYHCNNVSSSLLINAGLGDYVAYSIDEYIEKAVRLAQERRICDDTIHRKFMELMTPVRFMETYESTLRKLYKFHHFEKH